MAVMSGLGAGFGPERNQGFFGVVTFAWVLCCYLCARGYQRQGL